LSIFAFGVYKARNPHAGFPQESPSFAKLTCAE
jgi:hypothetical protein